jgi:hypothetical protein
MLVPLRHDRFTPRSSPCRHCFDWESGHNSKEARHEKEGQEQEEGNIKKWKRAQGSAQSALPREEHKEKRPLTRGRFVIVPSPTGTPAPVATPI